jgi:hypothetical protein
MWVRRVLLPLQAAQLVIFVAFVSQGDHAPSVLALTALNSTSLWQSARSWFRLERLRSQLEAELDMRHRRLLRLLSQQGHWNTTLLATH